MTPLKFVSGVNYLREFSKKVEMILMEYSGARGTLIHKKTEVENLVSDSFKRCVNGGFSSVLIVYGFETVRIITYHWSAERTFTNKIASG